MGCVTFKGEVHLTKNEQFAYVFDWGESWADKLLVLKTAPNQAGLSRYGFSVSKSLGGAVVRNRTKRLLREILRKETLKPGWDMVFIARKPAAEASYSDLGKAVKKLLSRAGILAW